ncbi:MAG: hypothetical protein V3V25_05120 [Paracoccaceae bacterium]
MKDMADRITDETDRRNVTANARAGDIQNFWCRQAELGGRAGVEVI